MTGTQQSLPLKSEPSKISDEEIGLLLNILRGAGWMKASAIAADYRFTEFFSNPVNPVHPVPSPSDLPSALCPLPSASKDWSDRRIRAIAAASHGQVLSYPGSPGYRLTLEATIEEIQISVNKLRHQAGEMDRRALEIDRIYHAKIRP